MQYIPALDGIRAIAIFLVILVHAFTPGFYGAYLGVDLFFVLSGFLITSLLLQEIKATGTLSLRRFYIRRLARLGPALICFLALYFLFAPLIWSDYHFHDRDLIIAATYLSDIRPLLWDLPQMLRHTWSLSIEQHYYLIWPLVALIISSLSQKKILLILVALFILATLWRVIGINHGQTWETVYYRFDFRLSGLMLGSLLAAFLHHNPEIPKPTIFLATVITIAAAFSVVFFTWKNPYGLLVGVMLVELFAVILVLAAISSEHIYLRRFLGARVLVYFGKISYSLYLYHYPVFYFLRANFDWMTTIGVGLPLSIGLAALSYHYVEPIGKRKFLHSIKYA